MAPNCGLGSKEATLHYKGEMGGTGRRGVWGRNICFAFFTPAPLICLSNHPGERLTLEGLVFSPAAGSFRRVGRSDGRLIGDRVCQNNGVATAAPLLQWPPCSRRKAFDRMNVPTAEQGSGYKHLDCFMAGL